MILSTLVSTLGPGPAVLFAGVGCYAVAKSAQCAQATWIARKGLFELARRAHAAEQLAFENLGKATTALRRLGVATRVSADVDAEDASSQTLERLPAVQRLRRVRDDVDHVADEIPSLALLFTALGLAGSLATLGANLAPAVARAAFASDLSLAAMSTVYGLALSLALRLVRRLELERRARADAAEAITLALRTVERLQRAERRQRRMATMTLRPEESAADVIPPLTESCEPVVTAFAEEVPRG